MVKTLLYILHYSIYPKRKLFLLTVCLCWLPALKADPLVDVSINSQINPVNFPIEGTLTVTHDKDEKIDPEGFILESHPLETSLVKEVKMSPTSETMVSIFSFQLPGKEEGFYVLPPISAKIGGKIYHASSSSYEVRTATLPPRGETQNTPQTKSRLPVLFRLEAIVDGPTTLYPGERTKLRYRILYNQSVDLTRSELPMVHPEHFRKVGDVQIKDYQLEAATVQEITQEIEASELGVFSIGPSKIEGHAYSSQNGQKIYDSNLLKAEALGVTLEVKSFPSLIQPPSFNGALGKIEVKAHLNPIQSVIVGDNLQLIVEITGVSNLTEAQLPSLQCQPGFSGFFQTGEVTALSEVKEITKIFYIDLRPLTHLINQIPAIEVSSFDPVSSQYIVKYTDPIPLKIIAQVAQQTSARQIPLFISNSSITQWPNPSLSPLEIEGTFIPLNKKMNHAQKGKWVIEMLILAWVFLGVQKYIKDKMKEHLIPVIPLSEALFNEAFKKGCLQELEKAFWTRLWEKGMMPQGNVQLDKLPNQEKMKPLYRFLLQLQCLQYGADKTFDQKQLLKEAKDLFQMI